jgi:hypothetical protein
MSTAMLSGVLKLQLAVGQKYIYLHILPPGLLNLPCGEGNFGKIRSACGQREVKYVE